MLREEFCKKVNAEIDGIMKNKTAIEATMSTFDKIQYDYATGGFWDNFKYYTEQVFLGDFDNINNLVLHNYQLNALFKVEKNLEIKVFLFNLLSVSATLIGFMHVDGLNDGDAYKWFDEIINDGDYIEVPQSSELGLDIGVDFTECTALYSCWE